MPWLSLPKPTHRRGRIMTRPRNDAESRGRVTTRPYGSSSAVDVVYHRHPSPPHHHHLAPARSGSRNRTGALGNWWLVGALVEDDQPPGR